jgi:hypothetical protein
MEAKLKALLGLAPDVRSRDSSVGIAIGYGQDGWG